MEAAKHSFGFLPAFPDGELINPYLRRVGAQNDNQSLAHLCRRLLARKTGLDCMPSSLGRFHSAIGHLYCDVDTLLARHTHFHYYCRGLPESKHDEQRLRLLGKLSGPVRLCRLPVLFTPSEGEYLICPDCRRDALKSVGFEFVHRNSVAPFVSVCATHARPLESSATQGLLFDQLCRATPTSYQLSRAVEFARRTSEGMENDLFGQAYARGSVRCSLMQARWISEGGRLRVNALVDSFQLFFAGAFSDERLALLVQSADMVNNALRALMSVNRALHPVWCILLVWFADECTYWASTPADVPERKTQGELPDRAMLDKLLEKHPSLNSVARELNVSPQRLSLRCRLQGVLCKPSSTDIDDSQLRVIVDYLERGVRPTDIATMTRVSLTTVYRVLSAAEGIQSPYQRATSERVDSDKRGWLALCEQHPSLGIRHLRRLAPAVYARLRRNAHPWLKEHSPQQLSRHNVRRKERAPALARTLGLAASIAAMECNGGERPPRRRSRYRLQQLLGVSEYALLSSEAVAGTSTLIESRGQSRAGKIRWATQRLKSRAANPAWRIAKTAGIRVSSVIEASERGDTYGA